MNDKDILKYLALELLIFCGKVILAMMAFLRGIWLIGWIVELIAEYVPFPITLIAGVLLIVLTLALPYTGKPKTRRIKGYRSTLERRQRRRWQSVMEEDMQAICDLLLKTLQATRGGARLVNLIYAVEPKKETVTAVFQSGGERKIDVTNDSGTAMIYDIMKHI